MATKQAQARPGADGAPARRGRGRPRDEAARQRILEAALKLLEDTSFAEITIESIAARARVGKATVYRWWPNKAAVVIEAFREAFAPQLPFPETGSFRDDIKAQVRSFARVLSGGAGRMLSEFIVAARTDPDVAHAFRTLWSDVRRGEARRVLTRHQERGQMRRDVDPDLVLDALYGPLYFRLLAKNEQPGPKYAEALVDLLLPSIASD
ncbi:MAG TPA: TetR/AcrR family transcriptional regulator [Bryobacteraceae bacterium]|nr:TetR/AcrR family transcriptional regulator [Bryobacteraceae bacterium]